MFIINKIIFFWVCVILQQTVECTGLLPYSPSLVLSSIGGLDYMDVVVKRIDDDLELYCAMQGDDAAHTFVWNFLPVQSSPNQQLLTNQTSPTESVLVKRQLQVYDTGHYICSAPPFSVKKYILVQPRDPRGKLCAKGGLTCGDRCVLPSYLCDGLKDCVLGDDEAESLCGTVQPCEAPDRLQCSGGRCIPEAACCRNNSPSCNQHPCCDQYQKYRNDGYPEEYPQLADERHQPDDYGFIQSTIYTVTACALIFMIAVVLLVSAICKMHMKRAALRTYSRHVHYAQAHRFPPCYEASRLMEAASNRSPARSQHASPIHTNSQQQVVLDAGDSVPEATILDVDEPASRPNGFGLSRLGTMFSSRYRQVPTQSDVEMRDVQPSSVHSSPARTRSCLDSYRSPTFCDLNSGEFYFTSPDAANCGRDLNYMAAPVDLFANRTLRRANAVERILDTFNRNTERPITLNIGRFQVNIPRFTRNRSATDVSRSGRRPDTPNVAEINIDDIDFVRLNSSETYTLNGRTIRLLGANFENYPTMLSGNSFVGNVVAPPPYSEVGIPSKVLGPPPEYLSRDNLNNLRENVCNEEDLNGNVENASAAVTVVPPVTGLELPPQYEDVSSTSNNNNN